MADNLSRGSMSKLSVADYDASGTATEDKYERPVSPKSIQSSKIERDSPIASACLSLDDAQIFHQNEIEGEILVSKQEENTDAIEKHLHWIRNHEGRSWKERATWLPAGLEPDIKVKDIAWGCSTVDDSSTPNRRIWDGMGSQVFEHALKAQEDFNKGKQGSKSLSHIELDVQGIDAKGNRIRVRRALEVKLRIRNDESPVAPIETTTVQLQRVLMISSPHMYSLSPTRPQDTEPYQALLEQLAQHEINKALDERNHFLREVFAQDVDHVRKRRESTIAAHDWSFQRPGLCIRGPDRTIISLKEARTDSAVDGEVVLTHSISIQQVRGREKSHLFDLPVDGSESERRIRQARWNLSSAIDRCLTPESAERFVLDKWVDGAFLPREKTVSS